MYVVTEDGITSHMLVYLCYVFCVCVCCCCFPVGKEGHSATALMQDFTGVWGGAEKGGGGGAGCTEYSNTRGLDHCCGCNI